MLSAKMMMAANAAQQKIYADDVFSTYLRTGTGADAVVTTGIDMTEGYMLLTKGRSGATDHAVYDSARGVTFDLASNTTAAQTTQTAGLKAVSTTGHTVGSLAKMNTSGATYVDWVFRTADKFFKPTTISHTNGSATNIAFPSLETLGMVVAKRTDSTGDWIVWHRSLTAGNNLKLNLTDAQSATNAWLSVSGATVTLSASAPTGSYVVYGWAHDPSAEGIIQCGSYVGNGNTGQSITVGFEPQFILVRNINLSSDWYVIDAMRGMTLTTSNVLRANTSGSESSGFTAPQPTAIGFRLPDNTFNDNANTHIYLAIRRPNKPPTSGTQVYNAIARTGTGAAATVTGVGFAPDLVINQYRATAGSDNWWNDRLRGPYYLRSAATGAEVGPSSSTQDITALLMNGFSVGSPFRTNINSNTKTEVYWNFRRAPTFFDVVCYTGTGVARTVPHSLGVAPELMILKSRSTATNWYVYHKALGVTGNDTLFLNIDVAATADSGFYWNNTLPVSTQFSLGTSGNVNTNGATYVTYLFATLVGISKVGSYTGNGSSQTINCGFTTGARFVLIKRTDSTGDWYVWDTARGITAGNDPHLSLNTTAAEVTTDDSIDNDTSGFIVNQLAATNINVNAASYIYLAIA